MKKAGTLSRVPAARKESRMKKSAVRDTRTTIKKERGTKRGRTTHSDKRYVRHDKDGRIQARVDGGSESSVRHHRKTNVESVEKKGDVRSKDIAAKLQALFSRWKEENEKNPATEEDIRAYDEAMQDLSIKFRD